MLRGLYSEKLVKRAKRDHGYPVATVAFYGPDDTRASKLVVAVLASEDNPEPTTLKKWFSDTADLRWDTRLCREVIDFIDQVGAKSVVMPEAIIGCPHEEGIDYPSGEVCPACPFWVGRRRFAGTSLAHLEERDEQLEQLARALAEGGRK